MKIHKSITDLLPKRVELTYIDYRESLDNSLESVQAAIKAQDWSPLDEAWDFTENQWQSEDYLLKELTDDITRNFDVDEERAESFVDKYREELREILWDRDESDPVGDLIRNTSDPICFYDTGLEVNFDIPFGTDKDLKRTLREIKAILKIKGNKYDSDLILMIEQGYCGRLVVFFKGDIKAMMNLSGKNVVTFKNPMVAIINTGQGSGDNTDLPGHEFTLPLSLENLFLDKCIKYSYTYDVCGMISSWCDCTDVKFHNDKRYKSSTSESPINEEQKREQELTQKFRSTGVCTPGDMDIHRHKDSNMVYRNDFPCGTKCKSCGTFWID